MLDYNLTLPLLFFYLLVLLLPLSHSLMVLIFILSLMTEKRRLTSLQELLAWFETKHYRFKDNLLLFFYFSEVCVNLLRCDPGKKEVACLWNDKHKYLLSLIQLLFSRWLQLVYFFLTLSKVLSPLFNGPIPWRRQSDLPSPGTLCALDWWVPMLTTPWWTMSPAWIEIWYTRVTVSTSPRTPQGSQRPYIETEVP